MKRLAVIIALGLVIGSGVFLNTWAENQTLKQNNLFELENLKSMEYFPLKEGNTWTYQGQRKYREESKDIEEKLDIEMRVDKVYKFKEYSLASMSGDIFSLEKSGKFGIMNISNKIYYVPENVMKKIIDKKDEGVFLEAEDMNQISLLFEFPMFDGQRVGSLEQTMHPTDRYKDVVTKKVENGKTSYEVRFETGPDITTKTFIPYTGISKIQYHHKGTPDDFELNLKSSNLK